MWKKNKEKVDLPKEEDSNYVKAMEDFEGIVGTNLINLAKPLFRSENNVSEDLCKKLTAQLHVIQQIMRQNKTEGNFTKFKENMIRQLDKIESQHETDVNNVKFSYLYKNPNANPYSLGADKTTGLSFVNSIIASLKNRLGEISRSYPDQIPTKSKHRK